MMGGGMMGGGMMGGGMMGGGMMGSGMMGGNMVGSGMMPMGGMAGGMPGMMYQQPMYAMQGQGMRSAMMGQQMAPGYGSGYIDALNGAPATVYGPGYGGGTMPVGAQSMYQQQLQQQQLQQQQSQQQGQPMYQQPLQQPGQPIVQSGGQPVIQPSGQPIIQSSGQPGGQPTYQTSYQQSTYQQNYQLPADQYAQTSQGSSPQYQSQPAPAQSYTPNTANMQQSSAAQMSTLQAISNPQRTPSPYQTQAVRSLPLLSGPLNSLPPPTSQVQFQIPAPVFRQVPLYLNPQDYYVNYEPTSHKVHDHHHALKALTSSNNHSPQVLSAIVGTYLAAKRGHETNHVATGSGKYSRPEVLSYNNSMLKLEALSYSFIKHHKTTPESWVKAVGPHRRAIFADLYNNNELVRAFCAEMPGGPLELPSLDTYALGTTRTDLNFRPAQVRSSNLNASLSVLSQVRTVILVDDSGSMADRGHSSWGTSNWGGSRFESRWQQARCLLAGIAPLVAVHNPYGIDLHFLNRTDFLAGLYTPQAVEAAFDSDSPGGGTPTGQRVNDILDAYMATLRYYRALMPLNLIVLTDGEAQDETLLHHAIEEHVTKIVHRGFPAHQFGVEFLQVGDDERATRHLEKLEEEVSRHHRRFQRDVVGVTPTARQSRLDAASLMGICVGGIDARMNNYMRRKGVNV